MFAAYVAGQPHMTSHMLVAYTHLIAGHKRGAIGMVTAPRSHGHGQRVRAACKLRQFFVRDQTFFHAQRSQAGE